MSTSRPELLDRAIAALEDLAAALSMDGYPNAADAMSKEAGELVEMVPNEYRMSGTDHD